MPIDASRLQQKINRSLQVLDQYRKKEIELAEETRKSVSASTPKRTGLTASLWASHILTNTADRVAWIVRNYGREQIIAWLEWGTKDRIEPIYPKKPGGVLAFYWEKIGKFMFLKHVHHKGIKPLGFVRLTRDMLHRWVEEMNNVMKNNLRSIWR